ncbi:MAG TPA: pilus assembly protein TadG-related protein, partial [Gemmataceae bacterium]|nr:pilus assembly protein TadG-related protein [Gemmataceae bacterium]
MRLTKGPRRHGSVLPLLTISLVALCGFVALAVDVGLMVVARTQAQNAADAAAMAGARSIDGSPSGNVANATLNAQAAAAANTVLGKSVQTSEVTIRHGAYHYDPTAQKFSPQFPPQAPDNYNLTQATVTRTSATAFARVFGLSAFNVSATAVAAHRPRDCCIVLDYSGSMNNESDLWNNESYLGTVNNSPNNTDPVVPQFGPYSSSAATLVCVSTDPRVGKCNITQPVLGIPPLVNDFYQNAIGASPVPAFSPAAYTNLYTPPAGDQFLSKFGSTGSPPTFAVTVQDVTNSTSQLPLKQAGAAGGYDRNNFKGYTLGPGYWGITFFIWPPYPEDPNNAAENGSQPGKFHFDWRRRFFLKPGGSYPNFGGPVDDNTLLWDSTGSWKDPKDNKGTNYVINYAAILKWIKTCPNNPFPPQLRAGNILFYDQIPDDVPASAYNYGATSNPNAQITDPNQRFWKEYIDYALGVWTDPYATPSSITGSNRSSGSTHIQRPGNPACSIGPDFTWGTVQISAPKQYPGYSFNYVAPADNPKRPRHRCWFGPLTMIQFMSDTGLLPGTAHDISLYVAKLGIAGALTDIQTNHPNDLVSMILFSRPQYTNDPPGTG